MYQVPGTDFCRCLAYLSFLGGDIPYGLPVELEQRLGIAVLEAVVFLFAVNTGEQWRKQVAWTLSFCSCRGIDHVGFRRYSRSLCTAEETTIELLTWQQARALVYRLRAIDRPRSTFIIYRYAIVVLR